MPSKKEQKRLAKKRQKEIDRLIELERVSEEDCSWYPDDCEYCRNCNFEWLKLIEKPL